MAVVSGMIRVMEKAARKAGQRLRRDFGEVEHLQVSRKGPADFVSKADQHAERTLWDTITKDRRFAGRGFKRQVPVGPHIADMVSFPLRAVVGRRLDISHPGYGA